MTTLDAFTQAYLECALWSSTGDDEEPLDDLYGVDDLSDEAVEEARKDCEDFQTSFADVLDRVSDREDAAHAGHDFWLTRNGHGAGFWDRGLGKDGDFLTEMSKPYGEAYLYVGDDGALYLM